MLVVSFNDEGGWIDVSGSGFWTQEDMDRYVAALPAMLAKARRAEGRATLLADISDAAVQTQDVIDRISEFTAEMFTAEDKIAIVIPSMIMKMQMRRGVKGAQLQIFASKDEAKDWLRAAAV